MAEVYVAVAQGASGFEKRVAIKRIHPHLSSSREFVAMLVEEAKLSVSLTHRNIAQTFDLDHREDSYFIVMEHVEGYDLGEVLRLLRARGDLPPVPFAAFVVAELCRGLDYAHCKVDERGRNLDLVHRDVSPQNVLLSFAGEVKVADFGIAKTQSRVSDPELGVIKGKYCYMSPEQAWGDPLDFRSDIFSAGIVLWELLVGRMLHEPKRAQVLLDEVRRAQIPPPSVLRPGLTQALDRIVARATAIDPDARFDSAGDFADALWELLAAYPHVDPEAQVRDVLESLEGLVGSVRGDRGSWVPETRDRASTISVLKAPMSKVSVGSASEEGEPTVSGWKSPPQRSAQPWAWWVVGGGFLWVAFLAWWFGTSR